MIPRICMSVLFSSPALQRNKKGIGGPRAVVLADSCCLSKLGFLFSLLISKMGVGCPLLFWVVRHFKVQVHCSYTLRLIL